MQTAGDVVKKLTGHLDRDHSVLQWLAAGAGKVSQRRSCDLAAVSKWSWKPRDGCRP